MMDTDRPLAVPVRRRCVRTRVAWLAGLAAVGLAWTHAATAAARAPTVLAAPGQVEPLPAADTPSAMPLPAYDKDADPRNEWSKQEFPQHGTCRWLPAQWGGKPGPAGGVSAAERDAMRGEIERVIAALKTAPVANPPIGFCPMVVSAGPDPGVDLGFALRFSFMLGNRRSTDYQRDKPGGALRYGELLHLIFNFNTVPGGVEGAGFVASDAQGDFFAQPVPIALFQGFPVYRSGKNAEDQHLVIPVNHRPLHRPVTLARLLRWQIAALDQAIKELKSQVDHARREHDAWTAPGAQAEEEALVAKRIEAQRARTPEAQARVRDSRQAELQAKLAQLRQRWDVAAEPNHPYNVALERRAQAQARLDALGAADAQAPACLVLKEPAHVTPDVAPVGDASCSFAVVERNPDYYDRGRPRSAIQIVSIDRFPTQAPKGGLPGSRHRNLWANQHMMWGLDWQQIRRDTLRGSGGFEMR